ncbi:MAG: Holliday junction resolvase RuvX [Planctomycetes bacterium]|nr:Holliday junction resolvase RuvX [Planctomycetota bacterium]MCW8136510.1 Holliday junction resolvase RuvX [Planctomycetota bacterium]
MRWIGVDFGSKYVGVAIGDESMCFPLNALDARPESKLLDALRKLATDEGAAGFVVGLPIHMNGSEGKAAKLCRDFAARLAAHSDLPVELFDERLSSWDAEGKLIEGGLKPHERKQRVHAVAAQMILQGFFNARKGPENRPSEPDRDESE